MRSLAQKDPVPLPEGSPFFDVRIPEDAGRDQLEQTRVALRKTLASAAIRGIIGTPISQDQQEVVTLCLWELMTNAHRIPRRHLTRVALWATEGQLEAGAGDDEACAFVDDGRERTPIQQPDQKKPGYNDEQSKQISPTLGVNGLGGSLVELLADDVGYSFPVGDSVLNDGRTAKIIHATFRVPLVNDPTEIEGNEPPQLKAA